MRVILLSLLLATSLISPAKAQEPPAAIKGSQPKSSPKAESPEKAEVQNLTKQIEELAAVFSQYKTRAAEGNEITTKWANTAALFTKFSTDAAAVEFECDLAKEQHKQAKESGLSDFMINVQLKKIKTCDVEVGRQSSMKKVYQNMIASVSDAVKRVEKEVATLDREADFNAKQRIALQSEIKVIKALDDATGSLMKFDPKNAKRLPTN